MGEHTKADLAVIRGMGKGLEEVKKAFDGLDKLAGKYGEDFGNGDLADKFEDFASNWEISREKLTGEIEVLAKTAIAAADGYEDIDKQLADALRDAQNPKKGKKGK